jgi:histidinol-phosphate/aromatic aminotransferase/cobyric acid decarboxylase-like protein
MSEIFWHPINKFMQQCCCDSKGKEIIMFSTSFNMTNMFWQQCQDAVVRIERSEHDKRLSALSDGAGLA